MHLEVFIIRRNDILGVVELVFNFSNGLGSAKDLLV